MKVQTYFLVFPVVSSPCDVATPLVLTFSSSFLSSLRPRPPYRWLVLQCHLSDPPQWCSLLLWCSHLPGWPAGREGGGGEREGKGGKGWEGGKGGGRRGRWRGEGGMGGREGREGREGEGGGDGGEREGKGGKGWEGGMGGREGEGGGDGGEREGWEGGRGREGEGGRGMGGERGMERERGRKNDYMSCCMCSRKLARVQYLSTLN